jgi:hypothetical protein
MVCQLDDSMDVLKEENNKYDKTSGKNKGVGNLRTCKNSFRAVAHCRQMENCNAANSRGKRDTYHGEIWKYC